MGIVRANQLPTLNGGVGVQNQRNTLNPGAPTFDTVGISLDYILDFWGQYRRASEAARAQLLATHLREISCKPLSSAVSTRSITLLRQFDSR